MPSGTAMNPGDVVKSHLGKSIEIINTDAEGRLVLADCPLLRAALRSRRRDRCRNAHRRLRHRAWSHGQRRVQSTDDALIAEIIAAGKRAGEPGWSLPLWDEYRDLIKSDVADIKNIGGRPAGAITAAMFLKEFAEGYPWVHLDIAGTAYSESDLVTIPEGTDGRADGNVHRVRSRESCAERSIRAVV